MVRYRVKFPSTKRTIRDAEHCWNNIKLSPFTTGYASDFIFPLYFPLFWWCLPFQIWMANGEWQMVNGRIERTMKMKTNQNGQPDELYFSKIAMFVHKYVTFEHWTCSVSKWWLLCNMYPLPISSFFLSFSTFFLLPLDKMDYILMTILFFKGHNFLPSLWDNAINDTDSCTYHSPCGGDKIVQNRTTHTQTNTQTNFTWTFALDISQIGLKGSACNRSPCTHLSSTSIQQALTHDRMLLKAISHVHF